MGPLKKIIFYLFTLLFYLVSYLFFPRVWHFKNWLYNHKDHLVFKESIIAAYDKRMCKKASWIGYNSTFKSEPVFPHGISGIFVSGGGKIGSNCVIYQQVTIGSNTLKGSSFFGSPNIGDNVLIGAGAKIIGKVTVGNNVRIGANAVVARDVPDNCVVVSTGRIIQKEGTLDNRFFSCNQYGKWGYFKDGVFVIDENMN